MKNISGYQNPNDCVFNKGKCDKLGKLNNGRCQLPNGNQLDSLSGGICVLFFCRPEALHKYTEIPMICYDGNSERIETILIIPFKDVKEEMK